MSAYRYHIRRIHPVIENNEVNPIKNEQRNMLKSENTDHVLHVFRVSGSLPLRCINEAWDSHAIDMAYKRILAWPH